MSQGMVKNKWSWVIDAAKYPNGICVQRLSRKRVLPVKRWG